ncbi:hypothetical protein P9112_001947 [Eukaryota sp. TZLM1-RC]
MKIAFLGAGYVGSPTAAVIADKCPDVTVTVLDVNASRIAQWQSDALPVYEPGLEPLVFRNINKSLFFSTDIDKHLYEADLIFICVNTPTKSEGFGAGFACDLTYVELAARSIGRSCAHCSHKIIIEKSTVPVRTSEMISSILQSLSPKCRFSILSNPEFLAEGTAINDLVNPDRVLIGGSDVDPKAVEVLVDVYSHWVPQDRIITMKLWSSELSKLVANAFLAQRVSSINAVSAICELTGGDVEDIEKAIGTDHRIGSHFLRSGIGFGGSCFRKDVLNLVYIARSLGLDEVAEYWMQVIRMNDSQMDRFSKTIIEHLFNTVVGKNLCILGFSFKANTGDTRDSPSIKVCRNLLANGASLNIYDPKVQKSQILEDLTPTSQDSWKLDANVSVFSSALSAVHNCDALVVLTAWGEFSTIDWVAIYQKMRKPAFVFDGRLCLDHSKLSAIGYTVFALGKGRFVRRSLTVSESLVPRSDVNIELKNYS